MKRLLCLLSTLSLAGVMTAQTAATRLSVVTPPQLVDCAPVTLSPCMSMGVTATDDAGKPAPFPLPATGKLTSALSLQAGAGDMLRVKPFFASAGAGQDSALHSNVILLMIDISGSMNDASPGGISRFNAVKGALTRYVDAMQEGSDQIAIVPFESHNVVPTIQSAVFSTRRSDLLAQLNALPQPGPKNNTALFQAVFTGVESLRNEIASLERGGRAATELQPHLIVMTDGKNEVAAGDDAQLLNGPLGLQQASAQVAASHFDVVGVGFGDQAAIDAVSLRRLSTRFFYAADANELLDALHVTRTTQSHIIDMTWLLPESNRTALTGRDQVWTPSLDLEGGRVLAGTPIRTVLPATTAPLFQRVARHDELVALIATHPAANSGWSTLLVYLLLFLGTAALLLVLWFWIPRLVWADQHLSAAPPNRWRGDRAGLTTASAVQIRTASIPAGFTPETESKGPLQRSPAQTTQVGPRPESARTRLNFD